MRRLVILFGALALAGSGCQRERAAPPPPDPVSGAPVAAPQEAVQLEIAGVPNAWKVSDDLIRGGQPTRDGFRALRDRGVRTVVNLRSFSSDRRELRGLAMGYEHIYAKAWHPERHEAVRFLQIMTAPGRRPVFVHCLHGSDRTGLMVALYRVAIQGWTKDRAIAEMTDGPYGHHEEFEMLVDFLRKLDVEALRRDAGID